LFGDPACLAQNSPIAEIKILSKSQILVKGFNQNLRFGEDLDFGYRAAKHGKYRAIPIYFGVSLRKFKKDGYLRTISNYINIGIRYSLFTKVGQNRVKYRFYSEKK